MSYVYPLLGGTSALPRRHQHSFVALWHDLSTRALCLGRCSYYWRSYPESHFRRCWVVPVPALKKHHCLCFSVQFGDRQLHRNMCESSGEFDIRLMMGAKLPMWSGSFLVSTARGTFHTSSSAAGCIHHRLIGEQLLPPLIRGMHMQGFFLVLVHARSTAYTENSCCRQGELSSDIV